jgi:hypothetical protein
MDDLGRIREIFPVPFGESRKVAKLRGNPAKFWRLVYVLALLAIPILAGIL